MPPGDTEVRDDESKNDLNETETSQLNDNEETHSGHHKRRIRKSSRSSDKSKDKEKSSGRRRSKSSKLGRKEAAELAENENNSSQKTRRRKSKTKNPEKSKTRTRSSRSSTRSSESTENNQKRHKSHSRSRSNQQDEEDEPKNVTRIRRTSSQSSKTSQLNKLSKKEEKTKDSDESDSSDSDESSSSSTSDSSSSSSSDSSSSSSSSDSSSSSSSDSSSDSSDSDSSSDSSDDSDSDSDSSRKKHKKNKKPVSKNAFVYPPKKRKNYTISRSPIGKTLTADQIKSVVEFLNGWDNGFSALFHEPKGKSRISILAVSICSLYLTFPKAPPSLIIASPGETNVILQAILDFSDMHPLAITKEDLAEDVMEMEVEYTDQPSYSYRILVIDQKLFLEKKRLPTDVAIYGTICTTDISVPRGDLVKMADQIHRMPAYATFLCMSTCTKLQTPQYEALYEVLAKDRKSKTGYRKKFYSTLDEFSIHSTAKFVCNDKSVGGPPPSPPKKESKSKSESSKSKSESTKTKSETTKSKPESTKSKSESSKPGFKKAVLKMPDKETLSKDKPKITITPLSQDESERMEKQRESTKTSKSDKREKIEETKDGEKRTIIIVPENSKDGIQNGEEGKGRKIIKKIIKRRRVRKSSTEDEDSPKEGQTEEGQTVTDDGKGRKIIRRVIKRRKIRTPGSHSKDDDRKSKSHKGHKSAVSDSSSVSDSSESPSSSSSDTSSVSSSSSSSSSDSENESSVPSSVPSEDSEAALDTNDSDSDSGTDKKKAPNKPKLHRKDLYPTLFGDKVEGESPPDSDSGKGDVFSERWDDVSNKGVDFEESRIQTKGREMIVYFPMTIYQKNNYIDLFKYYKKSIIKHSFNKNQKLRLILRWIYAANQPQFTFKKENQVFTKEMQSAKLLYLLRFLYKPETDGKRVYIVCNTDDSVKHTAGYLDSYDIRVCRLSKRNNYELDEDSDVFVCSSQNIAKLLKAPEPEYFVNFDVSYLNPFKCGVNIQWRNTKFLHYITEKTFDEYLFNLYYGSFDSLLNVLNQHQKHLDFILMVCAKHLKEVQKITDNDNVRPIKYELYDEEKMGPTKELQFDIAVVKSLYWIKFYSGKNIDQPDPIQIRQKLTTAQMFWTSDKIYQLYRHLINFGFRNIDRLSFEGKKPEQLLKGLKRIAERIICIADQMDGVLVNNIELLRSNIPKVPKNSQATPVISGPQVDSMFKERDVDCVKAANDIETNLLLDRYQNKFESEPLLKKAYENGLLTLTYEEKDNIFNYFMKLTNTDTTQVLDLGVPNKRKKTTKEKEEEKEKKKQRDIEMLNRLKQIEQEIENEEREQREREASENKAKEEEKRISIEREVIKIEAPKDDDDEEEEEDQKEETKEGEKPKEEEHKEEKESKSDSSERDERSEEEYYSEREEDDDNDEDVVPANDVVEDENSDSRSDHEVEDEDFEIKSDKEKKDEEKEKESDHEVEDENSESGSDKEDKENESNHEVEDENSESRSDKEDKENESNHEVEDEDFEIKSDHVVEDENSESKSDHEVEDEDVVPANDVVEDENSYSRSDKEDKENESDHVVEDENSESKSDHEVEDEDFDIKSDKENKENESDHEVEDENSESKSDKENESDHEVEDENSESKSDKENESDHEVEDENSQSRSEHEDEDEAKEKESDHEVEDEDVVPANDVVEDENSDSRSDHEVEDENSESRSDKEDKEKESDHEVEDENSESRSDKEDKGNESDHEVEDENSQSRNDKENESNHEVEDEDFEIKSDHVVEDENSESKSDKENESNHEVEDEDFEIKIYHYNTKSDEEDEADKHEEEDKQEEEDKADKDESDSDKDDKDDDDKHDHSDKHTDKDDKDGDGQSGYPPQLDHEDAPGPPSDSSSMFDAYESSADEDISPEELERNIQREKERMAREMEEEDRRKAAADRLRKKQRERDHLLAQIKASQLSDTYSDYETLSEGEMLDIVIRNQRHPPRFVIPNMDPKAMQNMDKDKQQLVNNLPIDPSYRKLFRDNEMNEDLDREEMYKRIQQQWFLVQEQRDKREKDRKEKKEQKEKAKMERLRQRENAKRLRLLVLEREKQQKLEKMERLKQLKLEREEQAKKRAELMEKMRQEKKEQLEKEKLEKAKEKQERLEKEKLEREEKQRERKQKKLEKEKEKQERDMALAKEKMDRIQKQAMERRERELRRENGLPPPPRNVIKLRPRTLVPPAKEEVHRSPPKQTPPKPAPKLKTRAEFKSITLTEHRKILEGLQKFGCTNLDDFADFANVPNIDKKLLEDYINTIIEIAEEVNRTGEVPPQLPFVEQIPKYAIKSLPDKIALFQKIRDLASQKDTICAEDLEFLDTIASHGLNHFTTSNTMISMTLGAPSESKFLVRAKRIVSPEIDHSGSPPNAIDPSLVKFPLRLGDLCMVNKFGNILDLPEFSTEDSVYPVGYSVSTTALDCYNPGVMIIVACAIERENNRPLFKIYYNRNKKQRVFKGRTADEVWELYRIECQKHTKIHIFKFVGSEMFGFTSPFYHFLLAQKLQPTQCPNYIRRCFRNPSLEFNYTPIKIGVYEGTESEKIMRSLKKTDQRQLFAPAPAPKMRVVQPITQSPRKNRTYSSVFDTVSLMSSSDSDGGSDSSSSSDSDSSSSSNTEPGTVPMSDSDPDFNVQSETDEENEAELKKLRREHSHRHQYSSDDDPDDKSFRPRRSQTLKQIMKNAHPHQFEIRHKQITLPQQETPNSSPQLQQKSPHHIKSKKLTLLSSKHSRHSSTNTQPLKEEEEDDSYKSQLLPDEPDEEKTRTTIHIPRQKNHEIELPKINFEKSFPIKNLIEGTTLRLSGESQSFLPLLSFYAEDFDD